MLAFCSTTKIATPCEWICLINSKLVCTRAGANPIDGSSINSTFGSDISARPIATICCSPPDKVPAFWLSRSLTRGNISNIRSKSASMAERSERRKAPSSRLSLTDSRLNSRRFSGTIVTPRSTRYEIDLSVTISPLSSTSPVVGVTIPSKAFSVVDLPEALPPSRQTNSPG